LTGDLAEALHFKHFSGPQSRVSENGHIRLGADVSLPDVSARKQPSRIKISDEG